MYYIVDSSKTFEQATRDLEAAVSRNDFGVLHIHDLGKALRGKGEAFAEQCKVFEICNPQYAARVMADDVRLNMALPCRISVYTDGGKTRIGMVEPRDVLSTLSVDPRMDWIAREVGNATRQMIDEAA